MRNRYRSFRVLRWLPVVLLLLLVAVVNAQTKPKSEWTGVAAPEERVSLSEELNLEQALKIINDVCVKQINKVIIDNSGRNTKIGVDLVNVHWRRALETILRKLDLEYEEGQNYLRVFNPGLKGGASKDGDVIDSKQREVLIEAIFFEASRDALREIGVNWSTISSGEVNAVATQETAGNVSDNNIFTLSVQKTVDQTLSIKGLVKAFENKGLGTILANPQIRVRAGKEGLVQVGQDFSIKTRDFAGNTIDNFVSAGTKLKVIPTVIEDGGIQFIHLKLDVERSTGAVSALNTTINKSTASTSLLMIPGEEAAIGGLYSTEKTSTRKGIPFLKDLPPWVFGIRYLAGYERVNYQNKELVILLKADLEPDLATRVKNVKKLHGFEQDLQKMKLEHDDYFKKVEEK